MFEMLATGWSIPNTNVEFRMIYEWNVIILSHLYANCNLICDIYIYNIYISKVYNVYVLYIILFSISEMHLNEKSYWDYDANWLWIE